MRLFVYAARWIEEEVADMIFGGNVYLSYAENKGVGWGGVVEENSVRGSFASSYEIDGMEGSMGATLTWSWEWRELGERKGEAVSVISKQALECPLGSKHLNNEALCY